jgi:type IV pilus assembly protein PilB
LDEAGQMTPEEKQKEMEKRAQRMRVRYVDLSKMTIDRELATLIPEQMCRRYRMICVGKAEKKLILAMADPVDVFALDDVKIKTGFDAEPVLSAVEDIEKAINDAFASPANIVDNLITDISDQLEFKKDEDDEDREGEVVIDRPVIKLVNMIILQAMERKASDVHIEPFESEMIVRYRIDGVLHETMTTPKSIHSAVVSRIKILAQLKLDERRIPQDGRIHMRTTDRDVDIRVSTLPSLQGESVVMRLLDRKGLKVDLTELGLLTEDLTRLSEFIEFPHGILLVTGPTGSGKSTTLYSILSKLNSPDRKVVTIEDPVEYYVKGIIQVQTNARVGLNFATGLRAFLRQDPDVMMVGEIRDKETATIATESALTGHLVLSTLHTNDASTTVTRLVDMGIEPFLISATMIGAMAQRLVRVVCKDCAEEAPRYPELLEVFRNHGLPDNNLNLRKGKGCPTCDNTGYKGRTGIHELIVMNDRIRELIIRRASNIEIAQVAKESGMIPLFINGLRKVALGLTTYEELCRVTAD